jgi:Tol biopolymer transport system component
VECRAPSWSRDGKRLVFARERWLGGGRLRSDVFVVRRDGRGLRRLVVGDMPVWSPDGTKIVFIRKVDYYTSSLLTVSPSGGRETLVARRVEPQRPSWSFDGKLLAFTSGPKGMVISVVSADGGRPREVAWGRWPVWSPTDGESLTPGRATPASSTGRPRSSPAAFSLNVANGSVARQPGRPTPHR